MALNAHEMGQGSRREKFERQKFELISNLHFMMRRFHEQSSRLCWLATPAPDIVDHVFANEILAESRGNDTSKRFCCVTTEPVNIYIHNREHVAWGMDPTVGMFS